MALAALKVALGSKGRVRAQCTKGHPRSTLKSAVCLFLSQKMRVEAHAGPWPLAYFSSRSSRTVRVGGPAYAWMGGEFICLAECFISNERSVGSPSCPCAWLKERANHALQSWRLSQNHLIICMSGTSTASDHGQG